MAEVEAVDVAADVTQGEAVDVETRIHFIALIVAG